MLIQRCNNMLLLVEQPQVPSEVCNADPSMSKFRLNFRVPVAISTKNGFFRFSAKTNFPIEFFNFFFHIGGTASRHAPPHQNFLAVDIYYNTTAHQHSQIRIQYSIRISTTALPCHCCADLCVLILPLHDNEFSYLNYYLNSMRNASERVCPRSTPSLTHYVCAPDISPRFYRPTLQ